MSGNYLAQAAFDVRLEWGRAAAQSVCDADGVAIIVDVLSFSTCVDISCAAGAAVYAFKYNDESAVDYARQHDAVLARSRPKHGPCDGPSLSPASLTGLAAGARLVLPSPNGSSLTLDCVSGTVIAGCLRNADSVGRFVSSLSGPVTVVAAGERWPDDSMRPAIEDLLGAGAIIHALGGNKSPEARLAEAAFVDHRAALTATLNECVSGQQLHTRGYGEDVTLAAMLNASDCVPVWDDGAYSAV